MKCECGQCWFDGRVRVWAWPVVGTQKKICIANSTLPGHCPGSCGCRLSVENGEPRVGEPYAELETAVATLEDKCDEYAAALNDRAELCDRLRAYCRRDRRAVGVLGEELETRLGICACDVQDGWEQHRGGNTVGACWAEWAQQRARARAEGGDE
jgi:hypothetical protein